MRQITLKLRYIRFHVFKRSILSQYYFFFCWHQLYIINVQFTYCNTRFVISQITLSMPKYSIFILYVYIFWWLSWIVYSSDYNCVWNKITINEFQPPLIYFATWDTEETMYCLFMVNHCNPCALLNFWNWNYYIGVFYINFISGINEGRIAILQL